MPLPPLIQTSLDLLLANPITAAVVDHVKQKLVSELTDHFFKEPHVITKAYQESFSQAMDAIIAGLKFSNQRFLRKRSYSKVILGFVEPFGPKYWQPFADKHFGDIQGELAQQFKAETIRQLNIFATHKEQLFQIKGTEVDSEQNLVVQYTFEMDVFVLEQIQQHVTQVDAQLKAFLCDNNLLSNAIQFFFREEMLKDERVEKAWADLERKAILETLGKQSQYLEQIMEQLLEKRGLAQQPELIRHNPLLQTIAKQIKQSPNDSQYNQSEYNQLSTMVGSALFSIGDLAQAEESFNTVIENAEKTITEAELKEEYAEQTIKEATTEEEKELANFNLVHVMAEKKVAEKTKKEKALAHFTRFRVRSQRGDYEKALEDFQAAIALDKDQYSLHDEKEYPIKKMLGAGGMGCVFLCENKHVGGEEIKRVAVKCLWESSKGTPKIFKEAGAIDSIKSEYTLQVLNRGYYNNIKEERAFFVTEYIDETMDGETWLKTYGPMDWKTGLRVGRQIAKGLKDIHKKGIYHLDLKPSNVLLKKTKKGIAVKIIDFGLSGVWPEGTVLGTLDFAPPEQKGFKQYGEPGAHSDIFAFGATMYRLLTYKNPRSFSGGQYLPNIPKLKNLLFNCVEENPRLRPESAQDLVTQLTLGKLWIWPLFIRLLKSTGMVIIPIIISLIIGYYVLKQNLTEEIQVHPPAVLDTGDTATDGAIKKALVQTQLQFTSQITDKVNELEKTVVTTDQFTQVHGKIKAELTQKLNQTQTQVTQVQKKMTELGQTVAADTTQLTQKLNQTQTQVTQVQKTVTELGQTVAADTTELTQMPSRFTQVKSNIAQVTQTVNELGQSLNKTIDVVSQTQTQVKQTNDQVTELENKVTNKATQTELAQTQSQLSQVEAKLNALESKVLKSTWRVFRDSLRSGDAGPEMVVIPAGQFQMGKTGGESDDEKPVHWVSVESFAIGRYEVTFAEYDRFAKATHREIPNDNGWGRGNRPVINISGYEAVAYTAWLSQQTGTQYRLPTEAEWEYMAKAGTTTNYWWGDGIGKNRAACNGCGAEWGWDAKKMTAPIGSFTPNPFGIYDTVGNVGEWVADPWHENYEGAPIDSRVWVQDGNTDYKVLRGGSWRSSHKDCRAAYRGMFSSKDSGNNVGFRVVRMVVGAN